MLPGIVRSLMWSFQALATSGLATSGITATNTLVRFHKRNSFRSRGMSALSERPERKRSRSFSSSSSPAIEKRRLRIMKEASWTDFIKTYEPDLREELRVLGNTMDDCFRNEFVHPVIDGEITTCEQAATVLDSLSKKNAAPVPVSDQPCFEPATQPHQTQDLTTREFLEYLVDKIPQEWERDDSEIVIFVHLRNRNQKTFSSRYSVRDQMKNEINSWLHEEAQETNDADFVGISFPKADMAAEFFEKKDGFRKAFVDDFFRPPLEKALEEHLLPLSGFARWSTLCQPKLEYIRVEPAHANHYFQMPPKRTTKKRLQWLSRARVAAEKCLLLFADQNEWFCATVYDNDVGIVENKTEGTDKDTQVV